MNQQPQGPDSLIVVVDSMEGFKKCLKEAGDKLVVVDFYATWCGPCKMIAPRIEEMAKEMKGSVIFVKIDVDEAEDVAEQEEITAMPTLKMYKNEEKVDEFMGANVDKIRGLVEKHK